LLRKRVRDKGKGEDLGEEDRERLERVEEFEHLTD